MKNQNLKELESFDRIRKFGEVKTGSKLVKSMVNLIKNEVLRIDSRFLESACGDGNFLTEILNEKLKIIHFKYKKDHIEFEKNALYAASSLYGVDILLDNVEKTRNRLLESIKNFCLKNYNYELENDFILSIKYILKKNIVNGDALSLKNVKNKKDIIFSEWSMVSTNEFKRRDYTFGELLAYQPIEELNLFSDLGDKAFIPTPIKEYPPKHYLKIYEYSKSK